MAAETSPPFNEQDPFLWLEEIATPRVCAWRDERNAEALSTLCDEQFGRDRATVLAILNAPDRIPWISRRGRFVYNFWRDDENPKGVWRRTTLENYRIPNPEWEIILDVDALARTENEDWVWSGATALPPDFRHCLVRLSRGGSDAVGIREFDLEEKRFLAEGFDLPEAKSSASWLDRDTLLVSSALGGEAFQTTSGYSRTVRLWRRRTAFDNAPIIFECDRQDMAASGWRTHAPAHQRTLLLRQIDFFTHHLFVANAAGEPQRLDIPPDAYTSVARNWLMLNLRSDWSLGEKTYRAGALLVIGLDAFMAGARDFTVLFRPTDTAFLQGFSASGDSIALNLLDNVRSRIQIARFTDNRWQTDPVKGFPELATLDISALDTDDSDEYLDDAQTFLVSSQNPLTPPILSLLRPASHAEPEPLKQAQAHFDARGLAIEQHHAVSIDGTRIPYFQIGRVDLPLDSNNPTLLTAYGGFQYPNLPSYSPTVGKLWLERGGVYVIANIRGGGEFGPDWHKAGMREGKKLAHDDFAAVAKDLIARGVTRPRRLAAMGGSNGGLLVGNMLTRYPELFGAIECAVPLLDMQRYNKLTAGASWISEYGDPDQPQDWAFLREFSPYHNVVANQAYPPILLTTSAKDDRVHPGHARKMAARLAEHGYLAYFHEPVEGGHAGASDNAHLAFNIALGFAFLRKTIAPEMTEAKAPPSA
jgi:prolyl oligopeptidase